MLGPSLVHHDSSAGLESQRVASNSTDGAMSMYNSISNLGSISHMGSAGLPAVVTNSLQSNSTTQRGSQSMPSKVQCQTQDVHVGKGIAGKCKWGYSESISA